MNTQKSKFLKESEAFIAAGDLKKAISLLQDNVKNSETKGKLSRLLFILSSTRRAFLNQEISLEDSEIRNSRVASALLDIISTYESVQSNTFSTRFYTISISIASCIALAFLIGFLYRPIFPDNSTSIKGPIYYPAKDSLCFEFYQLGDLPQSGTFNLIVLDTTAVRLFHVALYKYTATGLKEIENSSLHVPDHYLSRKIAFSLSKGEKYILYAKILKQKNNSKPIDELVSGWFASPSQTYSFIDDSLYLNSNRKFMIFVIVCMAIYIVLVYTLNLRPNETI